jgi:hypothetical protein
VKRHPITELPPDNGRYLISNGRTVFIASCRTFNQSGKPTKADWWAEGDHSETLPLKWWARLPKA